MSKRLPLLFAIILSFAVLIPLSAFAQSGTPAPTQDTTCNLQSVWQTISILSNSTDPGVGPDAMSTLAAFSGEIQVQLKNCGYATETPLPTATKVGTLTFQEAATATTGAIYAARTATAGAITATASFKSAYKQIDPRELVNYADKHVGEKVVVQGTIFNLDTPDNVIQMTINGNSNYPLYVEYVGELSGIYENDYVTVYGTVAGTTSFENRNGATITQAKLTGATIVKQGG